MEAKAVIFIMGVSGCGKTTIGQRLSKRLEIPFFDADDYHPPSNKQKMTKGVPLTDEDRYEWLQKLNRLAVEQLQKTNCIIACSALKSSYRDILSDHIENQVTWVHLTGSFGQISERVNTREDHFMSPDLLQSQFDILEPPKGALEIDITLTPETIVERIIKDLKGA